MSSKVTRSSAKIAQEAINPDSSTTMSESVAPPEEESVPADPESEPLRENSQEQQESKDLETLRLLKEQILNNQHPFFKAIPQVGHLQGLRVNDYDYNHMNGSMPYPHSATSDGPHWHRSQPGSVIDEQTGRPTSAPPTGSVDPSNTDNQTQADNDINMTDAGTNPAADASTSAVPTDVPRGANDIPPPADSSYGDPNNTRQSYAGSSGNRSPLRDQPQRSRDYHGGYNNHKYDRPHNYNNNNQGNYHHNQQHHHHHHHGGVGGSGGGGGHFRGGYRNISSGSLRRAYQLGSAVPPPGYWDRNRDRRNDNFNPRYNNYNSNNNNNNHNNYNGYGDDRSYSRYNSERGYDGNRNASYVPPSGGPGSGRPDIYRPERTPPPSGSLPLLDTGSKGASAEQTPVSDKKPDSDGLDSKPGGQSSNPSPTRNSFRGPSPVRSERGLPPPNVRRDRSLTRNGNGPPPPGHPGPPLDSRPPYGSSSMPPPPPPPARNYSNAPPPPRDSRYSYGDHPHPNYDRQPPLSHPPSHGMMREDRGFDVRDRDYRDSYPPNRSNSYGGPPPPQPPPPGGYDDRRFPPPPPTGYNDDRGYPPEKDFRQGPPPPLHSSATGSNWDRRGDNNRGYDRDGRHNVGYDRDRDMRGPPPVGMRDNKGPPSLPPSAGGGGRGGGGSVGYDRDGRSLSSRVTPRGGNPDSFAPPPPGGGFDSRTSYDSGHSVGGGGPGGAGYGGGGSNPRIRGRSVSPPPRRGADFGPGSGGGGPGRGGDDRPPIKRPRPDDGSYGSGSGGGGGGGGMSRGPPGQGYVPPPPSNYQPRDGAYQDRRGPPPPPPAGPPGGYYRNEPSARY